MLCEAAAYYKSKGLTLCDQMDNIYKKYGYYKEAAESITIEGAEGAEKIKEIMELLRKNAPTQIGDYKVKIAKDYIISEAKDLEKRTTTKIELPVSNVLYYELENDAWCCVRPSGTEPKIKFYMGVKETTDEKANQKIEELRQSILDLTKI